MICIYSHILPPSVFILDVLAERRHWCANVAYALPDHSKQTKNRVPNLHNVEIPWLRTSFGGHHSNIAQCRRIEIFNN